MSTTCTYTVTSWVLGDQGSYSDLAVAHAVRSKLNRELFEKLVTDQLAELRYGCSPEHVRVLNENYCLVAYTIQETETEEMV